MQGVPNEVEAALEIVAAGRPDLIKRYLPSVMNRVKSMAIQASQLSNDTSLFFEGLMSLVAEAMEATVSAKELEQQDLADVKKEFENAKILETGLEDFRARLKTEMERSRKQFLEYKAKYHEALSEKPTGFMAFIHAIADFFEPPQSYDIAIHRNCNFEKHPESLKDGSCVISTDFSDILRSMNLLYNQMNEMTAVLGSQSATKTPRSDIEAIKTSLIPPTNTVENTVSTTLHRDEAEEYLKKANEICEETEHVFPEKGSSIDQVDKPAVAKILQQLSNLIDELKPLKSAYGFSTRERKPAEVEHFTGNWRFVD